VGQQPLVCQGFLKIEASRSHSDTPHWVGLLWTSDQSNANMTTHNTQHSHDTDIHAPGGVRTQIPASERPQTHALDRAATRIGIFLSTFPKSDSTCLPFFTTLIVSFPLFLR
jgi:hypothetical protein